MIINWWYISVKYISPYLGTYIQLISIILKRRLLPKVGDIEDQGGSDSQVDPLPMFEEVSGPWLVQETQGKEGVDQGTSQHSLVGAHQFKGCTKRVSTWGHVKQF